MLTWQELVELERSLPQQKVLSVYLDGTVRDPAARAAWRRILRNGLTRTRDALRDAPHAEREAFDACVAQLEKAVGPDEVALGSPGWMGFFAAGAEPRVARLPVAVESQVAWGDGLRIAPALGASVAHAPAALALVDARVARIYRLGEEALELLETQRAEAHVGPAEHMGYPPRVGFHTGTRGTAATDEAQRELRAGTEAMLREVAHRLEGIAGRGGCILLGGIPETVAELERSLSERGRERAHRIAGVDVHATPAQLTAMAIAERHVAEQEGALQRVLAVLDRGAAGGKGALGLEATAEALAERAVERVLVTPRFITDHPAEMEAVLRESFAQAAGVELMTGAAAGRLDADGGGVAARLRFVPARVQPPLVPLRGAPEPEPAA
jgi:hypothetical protein